MNRARIATVGLILISAAMLALYAVSWFNVSVRDMGRSDFTSTYVGATLWSAGHRGDLYDDSLQGDLHASLIAPDHEGNLPFVNPPLAAVVASPLTHLNLTDAYRLFGAMQLVLLIASVVVVARFTEVRPAWFSSSAIAAFALATPATLALVLLGQWDGFSAFAVATAYACWTKGHRAWGGAAIAAAFLLAKPHLGLGVAAFLIGWRDRRVLLAAAATGCAFALANLAAVGVTGIHGWIAADAADASRWPLGSLLGLVGFFGSWLGDGTRTQLLGGLGTLIAIAVCFWLGTRTRARTESLPSMLAAVLLLSLVASPHLLAQDLVLLVPASTWMLLARPGRLVALGAWALFGLATYADLGNASAAPPGRLVPLVLIGLAVFLIRLNPDLRGLQSEAHS